MAFVRFTLPSPSPQIASSFFILLGGGARAVHGRRRVRQRRGRRAAGRLWRVQ